MRARVILWFTRIENGPQHLLAYHHAAVAIPLVLLIVFLVIPHLPVGRGFVFDGITGFVSGAFLGGLTSIFTYAMKGGRQ